MTASGSLRHREYERPQQVLESDLAADEKIAILEDWQLDLVERQRATEENMPAAATEAGAIADALRDVNAALIALRESSE